MSQFRPKAWIVFALLAAGAGAPSVPTSLWAAETLKGPVAARVVEVIDGDTLRVRARIWLGQRVTVRVRLRGVDAPALAGKCARERALGRQARDFVSARIHDSHDEVALTDLRHGKYAGRVLGRVILAGGVDLGQSLRAAGLARPYDGGRRPGWCALARAG